MEGEGRVGQRHLRRGSGNGPGDGRVAAAAAALRDEGGIVGAVDIERVGAVGDAGEDGEDGALRELAVLNEELIGVNLARGDLGVGALGARGDAIARLVQARVLDRVLRFGPGAEAEGGEVERAVGVIGLDGVLARDPDAAHIDRGDGGGVGDALLILNGGEGGRGLAEAVIGRGLGGEEVSLGQAAAVGLGQGQVALEQLH